MGKMMQTKKTTDWTVLGEYLTIAVALVGFLIALVFNIIFRLGIFVLIIWGVLKIFGVL